MALSVIEVLGEAISPLYFYIRETVTVVPGCTVHLTLAMPSRV
jgi:hypothetical protein